MTKLLRRLDQALQTLVFFLEYHFREKLGKSDSRRVSEARCIEL